MNTYPFSFPVSSSYPRLILFILGLALLLDSLLSNSYAKEAESAFWPADVVSWRTHRGDSYASSHSSPSQKGQACYRTVFFGDSICAGFDNKNPFNTVRSFCENMAIRFSAENKDVVTKYENFSKVGATTSEVLDGMKKHQNSLRKGHLIAWESGGNDILLARQAFRDPSKKHTYCRQCLLDNELGDPLATGPDPRCQNIVGTLQNYKINQSKTIAFVKENARPSAIIRVMALYYPLLADDKLEDLNCTDPDTKQTYKSAYPVLLPIISKGTFSTLDTISRLRAEGDLRFNMFESFPQFNTPNLAVASSIMYSPGESMENYINKKILAHQKLLTDPYEQTFSFDGEEPTRIMQTKFGTRDQSDFHPSTSGHVLIQLLNSAIPYDLPPPSKTTSSLDCD